MEMFLRSGMMCRKKSQLHNIVSISTSLPTASNPLADQNNRGQEIGRHQKYMLELPSTDLLVAINLGSQQVKSALTNLPRKQRDKAFTGIRNSLLALCPCALSVSAPPDTRQFRCTSRVSVSPHLCNTPIIPNCPFRRFWSATNSTNIFQHIGIPDDRAALDEAPPSN